MSRCPLPRSHDRVLVVFAMVGFVWFVACTEPPATTPSPDTAVDLALDTAQTPDTGTPDTADDTAPAETDAADTAPPEDTAPAMDTALDAADVEADAPDTPDDTDADTSTPPPPPEPLRILFIGNSFTFGGPVPTIVDTLANDAGWPDPDIDYVAFGGESLQGHRERPETLAAVDGGDWDVVVLQENSLRPTDGFGNPPRFKADATWFHDRIKAASPEARIVLYETWARHADHDVYPTRFDDPADMQAQLRFHYHDAADNYIPTNATVAVVPPVVVAPVGDAWELHLAQPDAVRLHAADDWHAAPTGQYLNALVIYATIYDRSVDGLTPWQLTGAEAALLQRDADATTGRTTPGGPDGTAPPLGLLPGESVRIDFGGVETTDDGWHALTDSTRGALTNVETIDGARSSVDLAVTDAFVGVNDQGLLGNALGWPGEVSGDSFFCGSFDDHATGLQRPGQVTLRDLDPAGRYTLRLFASRSGTDGSLGRLVRYQVGDQWQDLDASDNVDRVAELTRLAPDSFGDLVIDVGVSPDGTGRFCYLGALELVREF